MAAFGPLAFTTPWLLLGLLALPLLWWLLRAVPPAPLRRRFPAVTLLLGLEDEETTPVRTPWWLLLLRILAIGALIVGFAGPVLNPDDREPGRGPLLIVMDASWASAPTWPARIDRVASTLEAAARDGRPVALVHMDRAPAGDGPQFSAPRDVAEALGGITPAAQRPDFAAWSDWINAAPDAGYQTLWLSDGLDDPARADLLQALQARGRVDVVESDQPVLGLLPPVFADGQVQLTVLRDRAVGPTQVDIRGYGPDPSGLERVLTAQRATFDGTETSTMVGFDLPVELRNRLTRFEVSPGQGAENGSGLAGSAGTGAGGVALLDDSLRRKKVALLGDTSDAEADDLLKPLHYVRQALVPTAEIIETDLTATLQANPDVIILADVAAMSVSQSQDLQKWVEAGGLLIRFAGPKLAASTVETRGDDPLLPVRLRVGGRSVGGAMSWGQPKTLRPFPENSPFHGLPVPDEVTVTSQVVAQPGPELSNRVIASLADGTPLVTRKALGAGRVVLFHVTANASWSNLPLSGLFVSMLERLSVFSGSAVPGEGALKGQTWVPQKVLDGFGAVRDAGGAQGVPGEELSDALAGQVRLAPGLYAGGGRVVALNVLGATSRLARQTWPASVAVDGFRQREETRLTGPVLAGALGLLLLDIIAALWMSGRLHGPRLRGGATAAGLALGVVALLALSSGNAVAQTDPTGDDLARLATSETVLAFVKTGDPATDQISRAGLYGLGRVLSRRTSIEPVDPVGVDLAQDELAFFPILYWPVTQGQRPPEPAVYDKLNRYLRSGGMILFDTRDANLGAGPLSTPNGRTLRAIADGLAIPPLQPIPSDHVLTRAFYLLQEFPGRYRDGRLWVEAAPEDAERVPGMPFRNLNDGVTPVVIGGNDWAAAWAMNQSGQYLYPVGRGYAGERQREIAFRFGVNLVMHVLTGNYKSDQVHVPALLERLGQ